MDTKIFDRKWVHLAGFIILLLVQLPTNAQDKKNSLDGIYTRPMSRINEKGEEEVVGFWDKEVLELSNGHFRYWHVSDFGEGKEFPYIGAYSKQGNIISLQHERWKRTSKRYVAMTINGVFGLWTEEGLKKWKTGKEVMHLAILVRVGDGPVRIVKDIADRDTPDFKDFTFPPIKPLFDIKAVKAHWANKKQKNATKQK